MQVNIPVPWILWEPNCPENISQTQGTRHAAEYPSAWAAHILKLCGGLMRKKEKHHRLKSAGWWGYDILGTSQDVISKSICLGESNLSLKGHLCQVGSLYERNVATGGKIPRCVPTKQNTSLWLHLFRHPSQRNINLSSSFPSSGIPILTDPEDRSTMVNPNNPCNNLLPQQRLSWTNATHQDLA